jgi:hypothetical protein
MWAPGAGAGGGAAVSAAGAADAGVPVSSGFEQAEQTTIRQQSGMSARMTPVEMLVEIVEILNP